MTKYGAIALAVAWFAGSAFGGPNDALAAEPVAEGISQTSVEPTAKPSGANSEPSDENQGQAVHGAGDKKPPRGPDRPPLDLSLPRETVETIESQDPAATSLYRGLPGLQDARKQNDPLRRVRQAFPALLAPQDEDNPLRIKGRLLMDESKERSPDAVDGGQIIIEVQTE